jgi:predicted RNase H-like HicB family nuclease
MTATLTVPSVKFKVRLQRNAHGMLTAECTTLPGCVSQGKTKPEALRNLREAIQVWLQAEEVAQGSRGWKPVWERGSR